jgi:transcriptional regulator with XRE-family HTH domain
MARIVRPGPQHTGLYYAREAKGMTRGELVKLSGVSKQQLSRLENGLIRLRLDHLKPFANALGYTPEQMLLWGRFPGTGGAAEPIDTSGTAAGRESQSGSAASQIPELETRPSVSLGSPSAREARREGRHKDPVKTESWVFPASFVREQLHATPARLLVLEATGDSMTPTIASGDRVIIDTGHKTPTPDGIYAIRDTFGSIVVKRLQLLRSSRPTRAKIISDNANHPSEEVVLNEIEIVGKALGCLKVF